ncbi:hypothetical protein GIB67_039422 [Kingdonia uniflora]|uniref:Uncharacterized protein n=1 Tax=Kingdonia uniflora TaxID=39325 RepID=A0A7J7LIU2_9MAGN|nr:hypothetical protein GIB67_039422 [Kingdonia uniflora]
MLIYQYLQKSASVPYEDGDVKVKRPDGSEEKKGKRSLNAIQFETPELNFILEEQDVNVFDDVQQQALSGIPQLELPLVEPTLMCLNVVLEMEFRGSRKITQVIAGNSKEKSEGVYFSQISSVHFQEVHTLDVDTCHSFEVFFGIQTTKESETCEQMLPEGMESFYESIISHEPALVDGSFKSLPMPHLPNDNEIWLLSSVVEGILSDLKPHPPSASDGIYLDWHLLQEDRCSNENCSTYWNIFEEIDYITVRCLLAMICCN